MKNQFKILTVLILVLLQSCKEKNEEIPEIQKVTFAKEIDTISEKKQKLDIETIYSSKFLDIDNVLVNGNKIILSKKEFDDFYKNIDSTKTQLWECGNPLDFLDEKWMIETYGAINKEKGTFENFNGEITTIYGNDAEFATNNHIVLFDEAFAKSNSFKILSHNIVLDKNTTLESFKKTFPNAAIEKVENENECRARFYLDSEADDAFLFYFKNGKLNYLRLWWLLC